MADIKFHSEDERMKKNTESAHAYTRIVKPKLYSYASTKMAIITVRTALRQEMGYTTPFVHSKSKAM